MRDIRVGADRDQDRKPLDDEVAENSYKSSDRGYARGGFMWFIGAVLIGLVVPFTFLVVMPTNHQLLIPGRDLASGETRALLEKWGKLHAVRTVLGLLVSGI